jgi:hypothetical protein
MEKGKREREKRGDKRRRAQKNLSFRKAKSQGIGKLRCHHEQREDIGRERSRER